MKILCSELSTSCGACNKGREVPSGREGAQSRSWQPRRSRAAARRISISLPRQHSHCHLLCWLCAWILTLQKQLGSILAHPPKKGKKHKWNRTRSMFGAHTCSSHWRFFWEMVYSHLRRVKYCLQGFFSATLEVGEWGLWDLDEECHEQSWSQSWSNDTLSLCRSQRAPTASQTR